MCDGSLTHKASRTSLNQTLLFCEIFIHNLHHRQCCPVLSLAALPVTSLNQTLLFCEIFIHNLHHRQCCPVHSSSQASLLCAPS
ncbi:hypothetical protein MHYP_G00111140 [Metynnis hypsauchen]